MTEQTQNNRKDADTNKLWKRIMAVTENDLVFYFDSREDLDAWVNSWEESDEMYYGGIVSVTDDDFSEDDVIEDEEVSAISALCDPEEHNKLSDEKDDYIFKAFDKYCEFIENTYDYNVSDEGLIDGFIASCKQLLSSRMKTRK